MRIALAALILVPVIAHAGPGPAAAPAATGAIKGTVVFDGPAPERPKVKRDSDPYCAKTEMLADDVIVTNGKLRDVLVRVKNGSLHAASTAPPAAPSPAVIDQKDCRYVPRVLGVVVGQKLSIHNNDNTFHDMESNPHPEHTDCPEINSVGFLSPGQSRQTGNLNTARTCGFHDHDNPNNTAVQGSIVIQ